MLVRGKDDKRYLVMSSAAHQSLKPKQIELEKHATILSSSLDTIEACGGGSARCMAEVFLPKLKKKDLILD
jgi:hypothetical protein